MPITRADVEILLKPGARKIIGTYDKMPSEWKEIFKKEDSKRAVHLPVMITLGNGL